MKKKLKIFGFFMLFEIIFIPILSVILAYYGPFEKIKETIVTTAMTTMTHQYFATWFFSDEEIDKILAKNRPDDNIEEQNTDAITVSNENLNGIELVDVSTSTFKGYLLIVNDPSRVKLGIAPRLGKVGATTSQIVEYYDAIAGINAGGFADDALGTGGVPSGFLMTDQKIIAGNTYSSYSIVGLDTDNKMIVSNYMTYNVMKSKKLRDAVSFGPTIIINGNPTIGSGSDGGWGIQPRTAIGQRKDGTILMLVIDGRQASSLGATLKNVQDIFLKYGAYNAFNLDGGASSTMVYNNKVVNSPSDIMGERYVPCCFIVTKGNSSEVSK